MSFQQKSTQMAEAVFVALGEEVEYRNAAGAFDAGFSPGFSVGTVLTVQAIIDENVELIPDSFDSALTEKMTVISFLKSDVSEYVRGSYVIYGADTYYVKNRIDDDGIVCKFAVTKQ